MGLPRERVLQASLVSLFAVGQGHRRGILFAVPNGEKRDAVTASILSGFPISSRESMPEEDRMMPGGQGVLPGAPDLILLSPDAQITLIEVKVPADNVRDLDAGSQSRQQKRFMLRARAMGHDYRVVTTQGEFWDLCAEKGVRLIVHRPWDIVQPPRVKRIKTPGVPARRPRLRAADRR